MNIQTTNTEKATYHILKTAHEGFVTGVCMVSGGSLYVDYAERILPGMLSSALGLGTKDKTEEAVNDILESRGIELSFISSYEHLVINFKCLSKDIHTLVSLINEQIMTPRLDKDAFDNLKARVITQYGALKDDTSYQASAAFSQLLYPEKHISRSDKLEDLMNVLKKTTRADVAKYHKDQVSLSHPKWIIVGDVNEETIIGICEKEIESVVKPLTPKREVLQSLPLKSQLKKIVVKDKQSVDLRMGHAINIDMHHPDYLPLCLAIDALGGSFSARLMRTVRDEDGLTYNVGSQLDGFMPHHHGHWFVYASFSPKLLDKGIASIKKQLKIWHQGLSEEELNERKQGMVGKYKVMLSDARALASRLASNIEKGYDVDYLYTFSDKVEAITLDQVNSAIKQYIDLNMIVCVYAGSIE